MAMVLGEGIIRILADASGVAKEIQEAKGKADALAGSLARVGGALTAGVTTPVLGAFSMMVNAASDLEEATNKLDVTFGQYAETVKAALGDTVENFGMAKEAAYDAAATYGVFLKAAGMTEEQLAQMAPRLLQVAADMASFHNLRMDEALYKVRAALSGETEPLKAVGILMSEAAVQAYALTHGLVEAQVDMVKVQQLTLKLQEAQEKYNEAVKKYGASSREAQAALLRAQEIEQRLQKAMEGKVPQLTEAQKMQARYGLLLEQSAVFAGDFKRTQDSVANSTRMLSQAVRDLAAEFGRELLPYAKQGLQVLLGLIRAFKGLPEPVKRTIVGAMALAAALGPVMLAASGVIKVISAVSKLGGLISGIPGLLSAAQAAFGGLIAALGPVGLALLALVAVVALVAVAWKNNWGGIREKTAAFVEWLKSVPGRVSEALAQMVAAVRARLEEWRTALVEKVQAAAAWLGQAWENLKALAAQKFAEIVTTIRNAFRIDWGGIGRAIVQGLLGGIASMAGAVVERMRGIAQSALQAAKSALGIHSPSREAERMGLQVMEGFLRGLQATPLEAAMTQAIGPAPQALAAGAAQGGRGGPQVVNITINNPRPEAAEDSIRRAMRRLAYLGTV